FGWIPIGPFRQPGNPFTARPREAFAADPNAVTQSLAVAEHEIEIGVSPVAWCGGRSSQGPQCRADWKIVPPRSACGLVALTPRRGFVRCSLRPWGPPD